MKRKTIYGNSPGENLLEKFEQTYIWRTERLTRELKEIGEEILEREKLLRHRSGIYYINTDGAFSITYEKKCGDLFKNRITFFQMNFKELSKREIAIYTAKVSLEDFLFGESSWEELKYGKLYGVGIFGSDGAFDNLKVF